jgi:hypothetical protein
VTQPVDAPAPSPKLSITSLTLAIVALAVFWSVAVAVVFREGAADRRGQAVRGGVALAGIVLGVAAAVVPAVYAAWVLYLLYAHYQEFEQCIRVPEMAAPRYLCLKECPGILDSLCRKEIGW